MDGAFGAFSGSPAAGGDLQPPSIVVVVVVSVVVLLFLLVAVLVILFFLSLLFLALVGAPFLVVVDLVLVVWLPLNHCASVRCITSSATAAAAHACTRTRTPHAAAKTALSTTDRCRTRPALPRRKKRPQFRRFHLAGKVAGRAGEGARRGGAEDQKLTTMGMRRWKHKKWGCRGSVAVLSWVLLYCVGSWYGVIC